MKRNPWMFWFVVVGAFLLLIFGSNAEAAQPSKAIDPSLWVPVVVGAAILFLLALVGRGSNSSGAWVLVALAIGAALIWLNGTDAMPTIDNPCPGDEIVIAVNGQCYGMDADENREWLEGKVGR